MRGGRTDSRNRHGDQHHACQNPPRRVRGASRPEVSRGMASGRGKPPPGPRAPTETLRTSRGRSAASQRWLTRQINDP